tara:strand:+ start:5202 stop:5840 length:639 start_codon:yes stop_codon:yes gene_type:complete
LEIFNKNKKMKINKAADEIISILNKQISVHNSASLIVSGGESPKNIFNKLNMVEIQWEKIEIMLSDERLVDIDSSFSNEKNLRENFLKNYAVDAKYKSIRDYEIKLKACHIAILGYGLDGHFASLFPEYLNDDNFFSINRNCKILKTVPLGNPCVERLTLNMSFFSKVENIFLIINSVEKLKVLEDAKNNKKLPLYHLLKNKLNKIKFINDF